MGLTRAKRTRESEHCADKKEKEEEVSANKFMKLVRAVEHEAAQFNYIGSFHGHLIQNSLLSVVVSCVENAFL